MSDRTTIKKSELSLMREILFDLSDLLCCEKFPEFKNEHQINEVELKEKIKNNLLKYECEDY